MRILMSIALLAAVSASAHAQTTEATAPEEVVIEGVGLSRNVPCDGLDIGIYGADNTIELTGECGAVVVHGDGHTVTIDKAAALTVSGIGHTVNASSLAALAIETTENVVTATIASDSAPAQVSVNGADQTANLTLASQATIVVGGTGQTVNWELAEGAPEPRIDMGGIDNAVNRIE
jgi:hypothetical protein